MENKIQNLEDELKVLKNEVQAVLLDIKDTLISGGGGIGGGGIGGGATGFASGGHDAFSPDLLTDGTLSAPPSPQQIIVTQAPTPVAAPVEPEMVSESVFADMPGSSAIESSALEGAFDSAEADIDDDGDDRDTVSSAIFESTDDDFKKKATKNILFDSKEEASDNTHDIPAQEGPSFVDTGWSNGGFEQASHEPTGVPAYTDTGWNSESRRQGQPSMHPDNNVTVGGDEVDLSLLAVLTPWLTRAIDTVGKPHLEKLIEIYEISRDMPPRMKEAILLLVDFYEEAGPDTSRLSGDATVREGIPLLIELDGLLLRHRTGSFESVVFSILQERMTVNRKQGNRRTRHG